MQANAAPEIVVISDDLTGAVAACAEASRGGARSIVVEWDRIPPVSDASAVVVNTGSRLMQPGAAADRVRGATLRAHAIAHPGALAYKRVDSLLRGNVKAEVGAWADALARPVVVAPSAAGFGIHTVGGQQYLRGQPIPLSPARDAPHHHPCDLLPSTPLAAGRMAPDELAEALSTILDRGEHALLDVASLRDERAAAAAIREVSSTRSLGVVGAYGLLGAITASPAPASGRHEKGCLIVVSSQHVATRRQVDFLLESGMAVLVEVGGGSSSGALSMAADMIDKGRHVLLVHGGAETTDPSSPTDIADELADAAWLTIERSRPSGVVVFGGEGAGAVVRASRCDHLTVIAEPWPATPVCRLVGGPFDGLSLIAQPGARGEPDRPAHLIDALTRHAERVADVDGHPPRR
ncbi:uncharacterized protein YgbK (DUF1537 family) [Microbacterium sp. SLBN-154]|uniref:four-carbon acid sugar kinase family protein n=1 Tax=Microbacterium sp. SLBN-154 TaxID=2768458 RepID=UPI00114EC337|nr:four-carbon acid sugar kinase family protein [Microbacterium sp. SLBN-154]TQK17652.1 uncharacterized protein YgbK (DUF1537 family) [Microbacterium sp. SLBN-154]